MAKKKLAAKKTQKKAVNRGAEDQSQYLVIEGDRVPDFKAELTNGEWLSPKQMKSKVHILYFYPKDNTPGCTLEGADFSKWHKDFKKLGAVIIGVSPDSLKSHSGFKTKYEFPFELLSDESKKVVQAFDVWKTKSMYGREYMGVERSTFLIDADGKIKRIWRKVKVPGHVEDVLAAVKEISKSSQ